MLIGKVGRLFHRCRFGKEAGEDAVAGGKSAVRRCLALLRFRAGLPSS
jgi:hypothetical protein